MNHLITCCCTLFLAFSFFTGCDVQKSKETARKGLVLTASPGGISYSDSAPTIHIATTLYNPTNDTLSCVSMSCSYEDFFLTNNTALPVQSRYACYSNVPMVLHIPPGEKIDHYILLRWVNQADTLLKQKIKVGMYVQEPQKDSGFSGIIQQYEHRKEAPVLWSNEIDLERFSRKFYK